MVLSQQGNIDKSLKGIEKMLNRHLNSLDDQARNSVSQYGRTPNYISPPEVVINTDRLADAQYAVSDRLGGLLGSQERLVSVCQDLNYGSERLIAGQDVTNDLVSQLIDSGHNDAVEAFRQREYQIDQFSEMIVQEKKGNAILSGINVNAEKARHAVQALLGDVGYGIMNLNHEQIITRMGLIQALQEIRSTYLQTHENEMLVHQRSQNLMEEMLSRSGMTEQEKQARRLWEKSELLRNDGKLSMALKVLQKAYKFDDMSPNILLSSGVIQSSLGNAPEAAVFFMQTEKIANVKSPHMNSFILMNLASNLVKLGRFDHAERVMYQAVQKDPNNREVWFKYAITAWRTDGKKDNALTSLIQLIKLNRSYYRAQIAIHPDLEDLRELLDSVTP